MYQNKNFVKSLCKRVKKIVKLTGKLSVLEQKQDKAQPIFSQFHGKNFKLNYYLNEEIICLHRSFLLNDSLNIGSKLVIMKPT